MISATGKYIDTHIHCTDDFRPLLWRIPDSFFKTFSVYSIISVKVLGQNLILQILQTFQLKIAVKKKAPIGVLKDQF